MDIHQGASKRIGFCGRSFVGVILLLGAVNAVAAQAENADAIRWHMYRLRPLVGSWTAT